MTKRKREADVATLMASQPGNLASVDVFPTMEAAWNEYVAKYFPGRPRKVLQDAKFTFFHGVQAAANLMITCQNHGIFNAAVDQINGEIIAYETAAEQLKRERELDAPFDEPPTDAEIINGH